MKISPKMAIPLTAFAFISGVAATVAWQTHAQTSTSTQNSTAASSATCPLGWRGRAALGRDGNVTAINDTTITIQEEAGEGGSIYTVNAGSAQIMKNGATASLSDIKVGDKIFVDGTVSGSTITATRIFTGQPLGFGHAALGQGGSITAISGNAITLQSPNGTTYTVDAGNATVTKNGAAASLSDLKTGDRIMVEGTTSGTTITATKIFSGQPMGFGGRHGRFQNGFRTNSGMPAQSQ